jgi:hypothetical protein
MIWVDLDGVLADFDGSYTQRFGAKTVRDGDPDEKAMWRRIQDCGDFFLELPWTKGGRELWKIVEPFGAHVLTAISKTIDTCTAQKVGWCVRELGIATHRIVTVFGKKNKALYCQPGDVLLDDNYETCRAWAIAGGAAVFVPREIDSALLGLVDSVVNMPMLQSGLYTQCESSRGVQVILPGGLQ